jgi:alpha-1,3-glucosyltransferase
MLGLFLFSLILQSLPRPRPILSAIPFVLSLCFKQMALYYSPAIFIYLLSLSFPRLTRPNSRLLIPLGTTVILTFLLVLLPFLLRPPHPWNWDFPSVGQILNRVFPFGRGLWEDKVANTWCATNLFLKWRVRFPTSTLKLLSLLCVLAAISPGMVFIARMPLPKKLPEVFVLTALGFYLFGFQVHEKSILVPGGVSALFLLREDSEVRKWAGWFECICTVRLLSMKWELKPVYGLC